MCVFEEFSVAHHPREPVDPHPPVRGGKVLSSMNSGAGVGTRWESYTDVFQKGKKNPWKTISSLLSVLLIRHPLILSSLKKRWTEGKREVYPCPLNHWQSYVMKHKIIKKLLGTIVISLIFSLFPFTLSSLIPQYFYSSLAGIWLSVLKGEAVIYIKLKMQVRKMLVNGLFWFKVFLAQSNSE